MIRTISVSNFKSIKKASVDFPQFGVIIGHNGAGKTNLLTLINFVSLLAKGKQIGDALSLLNLWSNEFFFDQNVPNTEVVFDMLIKTKSVKYSIVFTRVSPNSDITIIKEKLDVQGREIIFRENGSPVRILHGETITQSSPIVNNQLAISVLTEPTECVMVRNWLSNIIVDTFEPVLLKKSGDPARDKNSITGSLAEKLYYLKNDTNIFGELNSAFKKIIPSFESIDVELLPKEGLILKFKEKNLPNTYHAFSASSGNLRAMGIITSLLESHPNAVFIDEIENSLHPSRIQSIISYLQYTAADEANKLQVILTTHNPILLGFINSEQIIYCYKKSNETKYTNPYKNKQVMEHLQDSDKNGINLIEMYSSGLLEEIFSSAV